MRYVISVQKAIPADEKVICLDFDGVIHSYKSGWQGETVIPDPPVEGTKEAIAKLRESEWTIKVFSTRCGTATGRNAISTYLQKYKIVVDEVCKEKPAALIYVDDRGLKFDGNWKQTLRQISTFKSWLEVA